MKVVTHINKLFGMFLLISGLSFCGEGDPTSVDADNKNGKDFSVADVQSFHNFVPIKPIVGVILGDRSVSLFLSIANTAYLTGYKIERAITSQDTTDKNLEEGFEDISDRMAENGYTDMKLDDGIYTYRVTAVYSDGNQEKRATAVLTSEVIVKDGRLSVPNRN